MIMIPMKVSTTKVEIPTGVSTTRVEIPIGVTTEIKASKYDNPLPPGGATGDLLAKKSNDDYNVEWITPANSAEQDNTRPITAAAVYMEIGNINALLETI